MNAGLWKNAWIYAENVGNLRKQGSKKKKIAKSSPLFEERMGKQWFSDGNHES
jgi:hypothetical protein